MSWIRGTKKQPLHQGTQVLVFQRDLRILWNLPWSASHCNTHNSLTKGMVLSVFLKGAAGDDLHSPIIFSQNTPMSILSDDLKCQALFLLLFLEIRPVFCMAHTGGFFLAEEEEPSFFFFFLGISTPLQEVQHGQAELWSPMLRSPSHCWPVA